MKARRLSRINQGITGGAIMKKTKEDYPSFEFMSNDEWDQVRYLIENELEFLKTEEIENLPDPGRENLFINSIIHLFERDLENKLLKKGFEKDVIGDPNEISWIVKQRSYFKCPERALKYSPDKKHAFLDEEVESALRSLLSLFTFKDDIENIVLADNERYKVFLRTFLLLIDIVRAGRLRHIEHGVSVEEGKDKRRTKKRLLMV